MFIDASAIVAILAREADAEALKLAIDSAPPPLTVSPLTIFEASVSLAAAKLRGGRKPTGGDIRAALTVVHAFLERNGVEQVAVTPDMGALAVNAAARYGKAVGHPADLNFGDCFSYACAQALATSLLFKGDDFAQTDVTNADS